MFLWDQCIDSDDEHIQEFFIGDTPVIKISPRDYNLRSKGVFPNTYSSPKTNSPVRKIIPPIPTMKAMTPTPMKYNNKSDTHVSINNNKMSTSNPNANSKKTKSPIANNKPNGSQPRTKIGRP